MQIWVLFVDSYRLLMSRKLFWISFVISGMAVLLYASYGFNEKGWFILFGLFGSEHDELRAGTLFAKMVYMEIFTRAIVGIWFTWIATILALISTAPIFNDFMSSGSIDLTLSKPIGRIQIFIAKYLGGLLFVFFQIAFFTVGIFLCVGWRIGEWNWAIFSVIPLVLVFFSYLYSMNVLLTMLTRSTVASLMLTFLFWAGVFGIGLAEDVCNYSCFSARESGEMIDLENKQELRKAEREATTDAKKIELAKKKEKWATREKHPYFDKADFWKTWGDRSGILLAVLPKTSQTIGFVKTWTVSADNITAAVSAEEKRKIDHYRKKGHKITQDEQEMDELKTKLALEIEEYNRARSPWYVIGTSLGFEFIVLLFAGYLFVRRDF